MLSRMQEKARENAMAFSREAAAAKILKCYESVIRRNAGRSTLPRLAMATMYTSVNMAAD